jgi:hypothetical protein
MDISCHLGQNTIPKKLLAGLISRCQEEGWMTNELRIDWIKIVCNRRPHFLLNKCEMLVLDAFKGHLTQGVKGEIRKANTDLIVILCSMTSQLHALDVVINKLYKDHPW